ncbi:barstar family protein [Aquimarina sp. U1-2]|uniref:barstar family protein n=1 Tax=Aquimarina sp. U1-2 TaxID=2823141 RepID=UPI001AED00AA|nr:barstar family protein [Aquimarina sp. U1-2]MBP2831190.1 barstar family protein [Aquimarina sp. U1-2]
METIKVDKNTFVGSINGINCPTKKNALREIGLAFLFADHYGQNLDALEDCLTDLSWIEHRKVVLIINDFDLFLKEESSEFKNMFLELLNDVKQEWSENQEKEFTILYNITST